MEKIGEVLLEEMKELNEEIEEILIKINNGEKIEK